LKQELAFEARYAQASTTKDPTTEEMQKLQEVADQLAVKLEEEKGKIEEYDKQIKALNGKILEQRQRMGGINSAKENNQVKRREDKIHSIKNK
jgi:hypothetical protein